MTSDIGIEKKSLKSADIDKGNQFCISLLSANGSLKRFSNGQPIWGKARAPANSWCQSACQCWLPTWLRLIFSNKTSVGLRNLQKKWKLFFGARETSPGRNNTPYNKNDDLVQKYLRFETSGLWRGNFEITFSSSSTLLTQFDNLRAIPLPNISSTPLEYPPTIYILSAGIQMRPALDTGNVWYPCQAIMQLMHRQTRSLIH